VGGSTLPTPGNSNPGSVSEKYYDHADPQFSNVAVWSPQRGPGI